MLLYFVIFISKIIENALSTLRLIVVSNGKKKLGAFLQGLIAIVWILVTGVVIVDINKDILKIVFFCLGSVVGSYLGSVIEEKIALGSNLLLSIVKKDYVLMIENELKENNYHSTTINTDNKNICILIVMSKRRHINIILNIVKKYDSEAIIITEKAKNITDNLIVN